jgi:hypothetical protein
MINGMSSFVLMSLIGYALSLYISRPVERNGKILPNRLPSLRIKNLEVLPNLRIHLGSRTYWLHHWLYLTILTIGMFFYFDSFSHLLAVKGVAIGGILHGLRYPDRFKFRHPRQK